MTRKSIPISLRFVFNRRAAMNGEAGGLSREWGPRTARIMSREIAIQSSDDVWEQVQAQIKVKILRDAGREVSAVAQQYRQLIIGASGGRDGVSGTIHAAAQMAFSGGEQAPSEHINLHWQARSPTYLRRKFHEKGHDRWFEYGGGLKRGVKNPVNRQLQNAMGKSATWTRAFGPISVRVTRKSKNVDQADTGSFMTTGVANTAGASIKVSIATVTVTAFGRVTSAMLPALSAGGPIDSTTPDGRDTGLVGLLPASIAYRLGGNRARVPYRPTLEPFISFFLTRSLPNAVMRRLQEGLHADIRPV